MNVRATLTTLKWMRMRIRHKNNNSNKKFISYNNQISNEIMCGNAWLYLDYM